MIIIASSFVFIVDSARCDSVIKDRSYIGGRLSDSAISCTSFVCKLNLLYTLPCLIVNLAFGNALASDQSACCFVSSNALNMSM